MKRLFVAACFALAVAAMPAIAQPRVVINVGHHAPVHHRVVHRRVVYHRVVRHRPPPRHYHHHRHPVRHW